MQRLDWSGGLVCLLMLVSSVVLAAADGGEASVPSGGRYLLPPLGSNEWRQFAVPADVADTGILQGMEHQARLSDQSNLLVSGVAGPAAGKRSESAGTQGAGGFWDPVAPGHLEGRAWLVATWCIAAALVVMAVVLAWLVVVFRRSSLGASRQLMAVSLSSAASYRFQPGDMLSAYPGGLPPGAEALAQVQDPRVRERVAMELAEFAKQSLVQGLYSQRSKLIASQQKAQEELAALEARLAMLQLPLQERIRTYEQRITELEKQLATRDQEMRDMIQATLSLVRERLESEKKQEGVGARLN